MVAHFIYYIVMIGITVDGEFPYFEALEDALIFVLLFYLLRQINRAKALKTKQ